VTNVSQFTPKKTTHVLECECGCQLFYLMSDGRIECRVCGHMHQYVRHLDLRDGADETLDSAPDSA